MVRKEQGQRDQREKGQRVLQWKLWVPHQKDQSRLRQVGL